MTSSALSFSAFPLLYASRLQPPLHYFQSFSPSASPPPVFGAAAAAAAAPSFSSHHSSSPFGQNCRCLSSLLVHNVVAFLPSLPSHLLASRRSTTPRSSPTNRRQLALSLSYLPLLSAAPKSSQFFGCCCCGDAAAQEKSFIFSSLPSSRRGYSRAAIRMVIVFLVTTISVSLSN